jgi:AsmA protein
MNKYLKFSLFAAAGLLALFVLAVVVISLSFDPNAYKPQLVKLVQDKKQRTLNVEGDIRLTFFPRLGVDLGRVSLSEFRNNKEFATLDSARFYLAWWPLLKKELVVDRVSVEGLRINLIRHKDGSTNFDDLLRKEEPSQFKFDIDSVKVVESEIRWRDEKTGRQFKVSGLELKSGRLAEGRPTHVKADFRLLGDSPAIDAQIHLAGGLLFDGDAKHYALQEFSLEAKGNMAGVRGAVANVKIDAKLEAGKFGLENLVLTLTRKQGAEDLDIRFTLPKAHYTEREFSAGTISLAVKTHGADGENSMALTVPAVAGTPRAFSGKMQMEARSRQGGGETVAKLRSSLAGNLEQGTLEWPDLNLDLSVQRPKAPRGDVKATLSGNARVDLKRQVANLNAAGQVDDSKVTLRLGAAPLMNPHLNFQVGIDHIDADRYLATSSGSQQPGRGMSFSAPNGLNADGVLRVGQIRLYSIKASNVRLDIRIGNGRLSISPFSMVEEVVKDRVRNELGTRLEDGLKRGLFFSR